MQAIQQVAFADRTLLNKLDLITYAEKERVNSILKVSLACCISVSRV